MDENEEKYTRKEIQEGILNVLRGKKSVHLTKRDEVKECKEEESCGVWVALEIYEEGEAIKLREVLGGDYDVDEILTIKKDKNLHKEFELMCWEYLVEQEVSDDESLYQMLEIIMGAKSGQVLRARVDSEFDELEQEVYITYKVKVNA